MSTLEARPQSLDPFNQTVGPVETDMTRNCTFGLIPLGWDRCTSKGPGMKTVARKATKQAVKDGQAIGAWLTERTAHVLLTEYNNRKVTHDHQRGEAEHRVNAIVAQLEKALGVMVDDPAVAAALKALDGAIWDCAVEHEDRAWHAAWTLAINLKGGGAQ